MKFNKEKWVKIKDFPRYCVSSHGRILALGLKDSAGKLRKEKIKKQVIIRRYYYVGLYNNSKQKTCRVHRLVALAFISNPENKPFINHIDGNRFNNHVENLEWVTHKENVGHAIATGLRRKFTTSKLNKNKAIRIRMSKLSKEELAFKYGVCKETICRVLRREVWL